VIVIVVSSPARFEPNLFLQVVDLLGDLDEAGCAGRARPAP